jgi:uncharacterized protein GlcG (DUF336 family)
MLALACAFVAFALVAGSAFTPAAAQQPPTLPYGPPISLDGAKRAMAAGPELEAAKNSWHVAITILDSCGNLVMFHKVDNTQLASIGVSEGKARTALTLKRSSKALDDAIAAGGAGLQLLAVKDITPLEGGLPIRIDGKIIGSIGVSGALQDAQVAGWRRRAGEIAGLPAADGVGSRLAFPPQNFSALKVVCGQSAGRRNKSAQAWTESNSVSDFCCWHFATLQAQAFDVRFQGIHDFNDGDDCCCCRLSESR